MPKPEHVAVGRVGRPHGVSGEVRIDPQGGLPHGLGGYTKLFLGRDGELQPARIRSHRVHGRFLLAKFEGVDNPEQAARLTHSTLYVERAEMPPLGEGEYYHADLLGCRVVDEQDRDLGSVEDVFPTGQYDVLVVTAPKGRWMLPVVAEYVVTIDTEVGVVATRGTEGFRE